MISALVVQAAAKWKFRPQAAFESDDAYRAALSAFLESRDWAAAHEVRLDRIQAEWTGPETDDFYNRIVTRKAPPSMEFAEGLHAFAIAELPSVGSPTWDGLLALAEAGLTAVRDRRQKNPTAEIPVFLSVVLDDGRSMHTATDPGRRLAFIKAMIRKYAVFGYVVIIDAFIHAINTDTGTATKRDAFLVHIGTRTERQMWHLPYRVEDRRVIFEPRVEFDRSFMRDTATLDPYAELFVSVPPSGTVS